MAMVTVLPKVNALPGAQHKVSVGDRDLLGGMSQHAANMGRHVIGALGAVDIVATFGHKLGKEGLQIRQNIRIRIFLDDETGGSVAKEEIAQTALDARLDNDIVDLTGNFMERFATCFKAEHLLMMSHR